MGTVKASRGLEANFLIVLTTAAAVCKVIPMAAPALGEIVADGFYLFSVDDAGNTVADFTPHTELVNATETLAVRATDEQVSHLGKRGSGCHPTARIPDAQSDRANTGLLNQFSGGSISLGSRQKALVCSYLMTSFV